MNGRSRSLLDLAHRVHDCTNCRRYVPEGCEPAHENGIEAGKGQSIKSHDHRHAALCHDCHSWLDSGGRRMDPTNRYKATFDEKAEMWNRCHKLTFDHYWSSGWLKVAA